MSKKTKKAKKTRKNRKGGAIAKGNQQQYRDICTTTPDSDKFHRNEFVCFIENSEVTTMSTTSNGGMLFLCTNKNDISPFITCSSKTPFSYTKNLVVKITFDSDNVRNDRAEFENLHNIDFEKTSSFSFLNEVRNQVSVHNSSLDRYMEPILPSICFASISFSLNTYVISILHKKAKDEKTKHLLKVTLLTSSKKAFVSGIMAMEFLDGYKQLQSYITFKEKIMLEGIQYDVPNIYGRNDILTNQQKTQLNYLYLAIYELVRLRIAGFYHGDFHLSNIMFHNQYYFDNTQNPAYVNLPCRAMIIDAGRFKKDQNEISPDITASDVVREELNKMGRNSDYWSFQWIKKAISDDYRKGVLNNAVVNIQIARMIKKNEFLDLIENNNLLTQEQKNSIENAILFKEEDIQFGGNILPFFPSNINMNNKVKIQLQKRVDTENQMNPPSQSQSQSQSQPQPQPQPQPQQQPQLDLDEIVKEKMKNPTFAKNWELLGRFVDSIKQSQLDIVNNLEKEIKNDKLNPEIKRNICNDDGDGDDGPKKGGKENRNSNRQKKTRRKRKSI
jgi:hypothetical protein